MTPSPAPVRVALVGVQGFGSVHRDNLERLGDRVSLVAVADPVTPPAGMLLDSVAVFDSLDALLAEVSIDVVILATPINTHARLARAAMVAGADVYVEKPTVASMLQFEQLLEVQRQTGRAVQVGFQSLGSHALAGLIDGTVAELGPIQAIGATGLWQRPLRYWSRSPWAGKRELDGEPVVDGVVTNPLAHAVATALHLAGARERSAVDHVDADLYRAFDIEADDTSVVRVRTNTGATVTAALTLCAVEQVDPFITIRGSERSARFYYTEDLVTLDDGTELRFGRTDLFENLLDHREHGTPLLAPLEQTGAFMEVLEAVRVTAPRPVPAEFIVWRGDGDDAHPEIADLAEWMQRAVDQQALFRELQAPFTAPWAPAVAELSITGSGFVGYRDGSDITATSSPRPYLHPLITPAGVVVSAQHPADHDWHFGLGVAVQDVDGSNLWGGRTYVRDRGYVWRADHGRIESLAVDATATSLTDRMLWRDRRDTPVLEERLLFSAHPIAGGFAFDLGFSLTALDAPVRLGSPGSNGRPGGGYGGLAWRLASCTDVHVRTPAGRGEDAVHGTTAAWIAWSALFEGGPATVALAPLDAATAVDPWFVRVAAYPGLGSALAWDTELMVSDTVERSFRGLVVDGLLSDDEVVAALGIS